MPRYRVSNAIGGFIAQRIEPGYECFRIMIPAKSAVSWVANGPDPEERAKQEWFNPYKFMDPNEINKKMGLAPNYVVLKRDQNVLQNWVEENFDIEKKEKWSDSDIIFIGSYKNVDKNSE